MEGVPRGPRDGPVALVGAPSVARARRPGRSVPDGRSAAGCARCGLRPRTASSRDSTAPDIRRAAERCSASRSVVQGPRTDLRGHRARWRTPFRPAQRGPRSVPPRPAPSDRSGGPAGPSALRLGSLTYRAVHGSLGDDRTAMDAVFSRRRRGDRTDRPRGERRQVGWRTTTRWVGVGKGWRRRAHRRRTRRRRGRGGRGRGRSDRGRGAFDLRQGETALRAEQRAVGIQLAAVKTDRHEGGKVNGVYHRPVPW